MADGSILREAVIWVGRPCFLRFFDMDGLKSAAFGPRLCFRQQSAKSPGRARATNWKSSKETAVRPLKIAQIAKLPGEIGSQRGKSLYPMTVRNRLGCR
jgi:hypothetical protein